MNFPLLSRRKADTTANGIFLILLGIIFYAGTWWPGIILAIAVNIGMRQFLTGRKTDFFVTVAILLVIIAFTYFEFTSSFVIPALFIAGGIYLIMREYFLYDAAKFQKK